MDSERSTLPGRDLHLVLDPRAGRRSSLEEALRQAIRDGRLQADGRLPSTRALAADLGVSRGTVTDAFDQLVAEGWLVARQGSGTRVAAAPRPGVAVGGRPVSPAAPAPGHDFRPGHGDLSLFPRRAWLAASRRAVREVTEAELDYGDARGLPALRGVLADYLGRARGLPVDPERLVVSRGFVHGFSLLAEALRDGGVTTVAVEDPSMARNPATLRRLGLGVATVGVDDGGADPAALESAGSVGAVVLTPAHQYPTGVTLSAERRAAWIDWARAHDGVIVEDDYDGEFRYDRQPVGALAALDPARVVYAGTTSKTLAPGLRLGWMVVPEPWVEAIVDLRGVVDRQSGALEQLTLAEMIGSGAFDRHVRHCRLRYRRRRDLLLAQLADRVPAVTVHGIAAGLHVVIDLPRGGPSEEEAVAHLAGAGVAVHPLAAYRHERDGSAPPALVVGFASPPEHAFAVGVRALTGALGALYA